jgi:hypothetical protein
LLVLQFLILKITSQQLTKCVQSLPWQFKF